MQGLTPSVASYAQASSYCHKSTNGFRYLISDSIETPKPTTMLCSISTQKSGTSKWLDRLRSSKGFPSGDHVNLEQFLHQNASTSPNPPPINPTKLGPTTCSNRTGSEKERVLESSVNGGGKELFNAFSNVLAELFNMGESSNVPAQKKGPRKQINPSFFASSEFNTGDDRRKDKSASPISDDLSRVEVKLVEQGQDLVEEEKMDANLLGFSRSEVTVIDTSCAPWKCDKLVFRNKNVWKVRDKRTKNTYLGKKKKRKTNDAEDGNIGGVKKQKVSSGEESKFPNTEGLLTGDKFEEGCKKTLDIVGQTLEKKHRDFALKKAKSSVVLIKNIPTSKKSGTTISKSSHRPPKV